MLSAEQNLALECLRDVMQDYVAEADRYINHPGVTPSGNPMPRPSHRLGGEFMVHEGRLLRDLGLIRNYWEVASAADVWVHQEWDRLATEGLDPELTQKAIQNWERTNWRQSSKIFEIPKDWSQGLVEALTETGRITRLSDRQAQWTEKGSATYKEMGWWSQDGESQMDAFRKSEAEIESDRRARTQDLIKEMSEEVTGVLKAELARVGPFNMIKELGRYRRDRRWHTTPEGRPGSGLLDLRTKQEVVAYLRGDAHE